MKPCPLCAEEIHADAIRCKHCKGDINSFIKEEIAEKSRSIKLQSEARSKNLIFAAYSISGILVGATFSLSAFELLSLPILILCGALSVILFPLGVKTGWSIGQAVKPDLVLATTQIDLFWKKVQYAIVPYILAPIIGVVFAAAPFYFFIDRAEAEKTTIIETEQP